MALNIEKELAALRRMTPREVRAPYAEVCGEPSRSGNKAYLVKRIAWRLQSLEEGTPASQNGRVRRQVTDLRPAVEFDPMHVPAALRQRPQWVCWRYVERDGNLTKVPIDARTGETADSTNPTTWGTFEEAVQRLSEDTTLAGVGFVFSPDDPFTGICERRSVPAPL